jgi:hypothetical protein
VQSDARLVLKGSASDRTVDASGLPDMRWAQVNCAILCREDPGVAFEYEGLMT